MLAVTSIPSTNLTSSALFSGGDWTLMHSDWAMGSCIEKTAGIGATKAMLNGVPRCATVLRDCLPLTREATSLGLVFLQDRMSCTRRKYHALLAGTVPRMIMGSP